MKKRSKWVSEFCSLDQQKQLEVAEAIRDQLLFNGWYDDDDKIKARIISEFFGNLKQYMPSDRVQELNNLLVKFAVLSPDKQREAMDKILTTIKFYIDKQKQEDNDNICSEQGHTFGKWQKITWTTEGVYWDAGAQGLVDVEHKAWERKCNRCGFIERVDTEPQELVQEREAKEKKARIRSLERELKKLKGE